MKVVLVGSGYAGTLVANRVARKVKEAEVTVINPRPEFVERVRLHQQIAGTRSAATPLTEMLRDGITARIGTVDKVGDGAVALADGERIDFDHAFLAVGSTVKPMAGSVPVGTWEGAQQARSALATLPSGGRGHHYRRWPDRYRDRGRNRRGPAGSAGKTGRVPGRRRPLRRRRSTDSHRPATADGRAHR